MEFVMKTGRGGALILFCMLMLTGRSSADGAAWKAGVALRSITPRGSMWMAGYAARKKPAEATVHDLHAKALALEDAAGKRFVLVAADLIGIPRDMAVAVAQQAADRFELPREALLLNASHTHCGPEIRPGKDALLALAPEQRVKVKAYADRLTGELVTLIGAALNDLQPAQLAVGRGSADFARNRRFPTSEGFVNRRYDDGPVDHDVPVLRVEDPAGKTRAVVFGYACHNTTLSFLQWCGDYAGFAQRNIEQAHPGAAALFVAGCGGDQNPYPRRTQALAEQHGRSLADAVEATLHGALKPVHGPLRSAFEEVTLDFQPLPDKASLQADLQSDNVYRRRKAAYLLERLATPAGIDMTYPCPVHVVRLGDDVLLIALGGEAVVDYALTLKAEYNQPLTWVAGYSNDVFGYLPSLRVLREGGYEGGQAMLYGPLPGPFTETVEQRVTATVRRLVKQVSRREP